MVADYFHTLDMEGGIAAIDFFTEDVVVDVGKMSCSGRAEMARHYQAREERILHEQQSGVRTGRHGPVNFRVVFPATDRATISVLVVTFSGGGEPPLPNATTPSVVTDVRLECRRETDGQWRIFQYDGAPIFVGNDPFLIKSLIKS